MIHNKCVEKLCQDSLQTFLELFPALLKSLCTIIGTMLKKTSLSGELIASERHHARSAITTTQADRRSVV